MIRVFKIDSSFDYPHQGHDMRNPDFVTFEQQKLRPADASAQSDQHLCHLLSSEQV